MLLLKEKYTEHKGDERVHVIAKAAVENVTRIDRPDIKAPVDCDNPEDGSRYLMVALSLIVSRKTCIRPVDISRIIVKTRAKMIRKDKINSGSTLLSRFQYAGSIPHRA